MRLMMYCKLFFFLLVFGLTPLALVAQHGVNTKVTNEKSILVFVEQYQGDLKRRQQFVVEKERNYEV